ncbi:DUF2059 domain-containing protein [Nitrospirillum sp. BR 11163]|uniref:DUF2059 domain-containing protein n=1 Tax=Nitrospirillum sp. BR 11163 TaxID=3104323 RepID=UPI002AFE28C6|nr:DUF2059 domain-containing protein [Nitrospirillum sp. BR 11163]MEA1673864.1 DUF2059 domain-containing protein [Nitrospirillum sp. BR 11163]
MREGLFAGVAGLCQAIVVGAVIMAAAPVVAQTASPTPKALELARALADRMDADDLMQQVLGATVQPLTFNLKAANPGREADVDALFEHTLLPDFRKAMGPVLEGYAQAYAARFTEAELAAILAFYDSPAGAKLLKEMPGLRQRGRARAQAVLPQALGPVLGGFITACKGKGLTIPQG